MKHLLHISLFFILLIGLVSCATALKAGTSKRSIKDKWEQRAIFRAEYPHLRTHLNEGLINIYRVTEITRQDGSRDYKIRYKFIRKHFTDYSERMSVLKENFPEIYQMYSNGAVIVNDLYEYVDRNEIIQYHINYRHVTNPTYNYYR